MKRIYLDHAATTYLDKRVKNAMDSYWHKNFGNASAIYKEGREAKIVLDGSRRIIADLIGARSDEIIFTSGGTEGNNLAILGVIANVGKFHFPGTKSAKPHVITSNIEHHSVLYPIKELEKRKLIEASYIKAGKNGIINSKDVAGELRSSTVLISIMYANNEIGTIQPISEISKIVKNVRNRQTVFFHTDACQAGEYLSMDVQKLGIDLMTANGSKIYGPKGTGFLYVKNGVKLQPFMHGGNQENGLRPGTENIPGIVGLAEAFKIARKERKKESERLIKLRDYLIRNILEKIPNVILNGDLNKRLPNNVNISILNVEGESMVLYLDEKGIACSTGSACTSGSLDPSHVITALGRRHEYAHGSLRFSLGRRTTKKDIDYVLKVLPPIVEKLRQMSPVRFRTRSKYKI
jgi:cysteine desulfurase